jgi:hypothetical protein
MQTQKIGHSQNAKHRVPWNAPLNHEDTFLASNSISTNNASNPNKKIKHRQYKQ